MFKGPESRLLAAATVFFLLFAAHVAVGKVAILNGATEPPGLGDVGEALILFVSVCLFVAAILRREAAER